MSCISHSVASDRLTTGHRILEQRKSGAKAKASGPEVVDMSDVMDGCQRKARDHARTPVQVRLLSVTKGLCRLAS